MADGRTQAAKGDLAGEAPQLGFELVELHDPVCEPRVLAPQGAPRNGEDAAEFGPIEQGLQEVASHQTARAREQRQPGFGICHE